MGDPKTIVPYIVTQGYDYRKHLGSLTLILSLLYNQYCLDKSAEGLLGRDGSSRSTLRARRRAYHFVALWEPDHLQGTA